MLHPLREQYEAVREGVLVNLLSHEFPLATPRKRGTLALYGMKCITDEIIGVGGLVHRRGPNAIQRMRPSPHG